MLRAGILLGEAVVVAVGMMVVAAAVGVMSFLEKRSLLVMKMEVEYLGVSFELVGGDILNLGGVFVAVVVEMKVEDFELEVEVVVRLV